MSDKLSFNTIIKWVIVAVLVIVALNVIATVLNVAFALGGFLLFRVLPLVLLAWLLLKGLEHLRNRDGGAPETEL
jgi:hypothetical protein